MSTAQADCGDVDGELDRALQAVLLADAGAARAALVAVEATLACDDSHTPAQLARMFLLDAAVMSFEGEESSANLSFRAAQRLEPSVWVDALGPRMREAYERAGQEQSEYGTLVVQASSDWDTRLDTRWVRGEERVPAGLYVVQITRGDDIGFGRIVAVSEGETHTLAPTLPTSPSIDEAVDPTESGDAVSSEVPPDAADDSGFMWTLGGGVSTSLGTALSGTLDTGLQVAEPAVKVTLPVELGGRVQTASVWVHPRIGIGTLLGGKYLYALDDGVHAQVWAVRLNVSAGARLSAVDVGGSVGLSYPGRLCARGLVGFALGEGPGFAELRAGADLGTGGRVEPAAALMAGVRIR